MRRGKLKIFNSKAEYNEFLESFEGTLVAMVNGESEIQYQRVDYEHKEYGFGDICLWDCVQKKVLFVPADEYDTNYYWQQVESWDGNDDGGGERSGPIKEGNRGTTLVYRFYPIAICVIPSGMLSSDCGVFMSLYSGDSMWMENLPNEGHESGLQQRNTIRPVIDVLDQSTTLVENPDASYLEDNWVMIPTDNDKAKNPIQCSSNTSLWYNDKGWGFDDPEYYDDPLPAVPPLLIDGWALNTELFLQNSNDSDLLADMDGLANTEALINDTYDHIAASNCYRYGEGLAGDIPVYYPVDEDSGEPVDQKDQQKSGSSNGLPDYLMHWYLPSITELMLAVTRWKVINYICNEYLDRGGLFTNNYYEWSSSEYDGQQSLVVDSAGDVHPVFKGLNADYHAFCRIPCKIKVEATNPVNDKDDNTGISVIDPGGGSDIVKGEQSK